VHICGDGEVPLSLPAVADTLAESAEAKVAMRVSRPPSASTKSVPQASAIAGTSGAPKVLPLLGSLSGDRMMLMHDDPLPGNLA
jgi:hypothetical protein